MKLSKIINKKKKLKDECNKINYLLKSNEIQSAKQIDDYILKIKSFEDEIEENKNSYINFEKKITYEKTESKKLNDKIKNMSDINNS
jgi:chromosome segregation ATPase